MARALEIFLDRLREGQVEKFTLSLPPSLLGPSEAELLFESPVLVQGEAYLSEEELVLRFSLQSEILMPCSICNRMIPQKIEVSSTYHTLPLEEIPSNVFDPSSLFRETLLLELPQYVECGDKCPQRETLAPYLQKTEAPSSSFPQHYPFEQLE